MIVRNDNLSSLVRVSKYNNNERTLSDEQISQAAEDPTMFRNMSEREISNKKRVQKEADRKEAISNIREKETRVRVELGVLNVKKTPQNSMERSLLEKEVIDLTALLNII